MDSSKLDISGKESEKEPLSPAATYKAIPEDEMDEQRSKANSHEVDGADEKMLLSEDNKVAPNSNVNLTEIKFTTNEKNGDAKLDIGELKNEFVGLTKEELMKTANDPFWVRLRWFLFISFWVLWAGMLIGAIMIIVAAPKCTPPQPKTWWEEGPITNIDTPLDAEATQNLANNHNGFILSLPTDTYESAPSEFMSFLVTNKDLNIILEVNPATSNKWFALSVDNNPDYKDYYIWRDPKTGDAGNNYPNNWLSKFSNEENKTSAWIYSEKRKQFYYAPEGQPQLNFRNKKVIEEFNNVLKQYLHIGVDGFILKKVPGLLVDSAFQDEVVRTEPSIYTLANYRFYKHDKTEDLEELQPILREWRDIVKNKSENGVLMMNDLLTSDKPYTHNNISLIDLPLTKNIFNHKELHAAVLLNEINATYISYDNNWPAWNVSKTSYPKGTLELVVYLLKGSPIIDHDYAVKEELREARKSPSVLFGIQKLYTAANNTVFAYIRTYPGNPGYLIAFNPTNERVEVDFPKDIPEVPEEVTVQLFSPNYNETDVGARLKKSAHNFPISARSSIIFSYVPKSNK